MTQSGSASLHGRSDPGGAVFDGAERSCARVRSVVDRGLRSLLRRRFGQAPLRFSLRDGTDLTIFGEEPQRIRVTLPDHPGGLEKVAALIASQGANIVQATHDRTYFGVHLGEAMIDVTMETRGPLHVDQLLGELTTSGYTFERVM